MICIEAAQTINILLDAGQTQYSLEEQQLLRNRPIKSIAFYSGGVTEDGNTIADPSDAYLHLKEWLSNDVRINLPCKSLLFQPQFPVLQFLEFDPRPFDFQESYVKFGTAPTTGEYLQLVVVYEWAYEQK